MTYDPNTPIGSLSPRAQVPQLRSNFNRYDTVFQINHEQFNSNHRGKHKFVLFKQQTTDPTVPGNQSTLYAKEATSAAFPAQPEVFLRLPQYLPNDVANTPMQITYPQVVTAPGVGVPYQSFLPGGYVVYTASIPTASFPGTSLQITLTPAPSAILAVVIQRNSGDFSNVTTRIDNATQFTIFRGGAGTGPYNYIAIARA